MFHSVGKVPFSIMSLNILSREGMRKCRPCLIISFKIVSVPDAFLFLSLDI